MGLSALGHAPLFGKLGLVICALPLIMGIWNVIRPSDHRLALMRPLSLAAIFASVTNLLLGLVNGLHASAMVAQPGTSNLPPAGVVMAEALIPSFVGFSFLTVAWLLVAIAMRKA